MPRGARAGALWTGPSPTMGAPMTPTGFAVDAEPLPWSRYRRRALPLAHLLPALALLAALTGCAPGAPGFLGRVESARSGETAQPGDEARAQRFRATLDALREEYAFAGATAAYALADGSVRSFATGLADVEAGIPMRPDSRLLSGSIGKTFVAALALDLERRGRLDLDDLVADWLGDEPWYRRLPNASTITLRQLLTHSAGLADHVYEPVFQQAVGILLRGMDPDPDRTFAPRQLVALILDREPLFPPGQGFSYTDTGYLVAGLVLEKAAGAPYYEELKRRLLDPLGLHLTSPSNRRHLDGLAVGYLHWRGEGGRVERVVEADGDLIFNPALEWTGGGLVTCSSDLVRWAKALYEGRALPEEGNERDYLPELLESGYRGADASARYGLGVFLYDTPFGPAWGHSGWFPGYNSLMRYYPEHGVALAMQVNRDFGTDRIDFAQRLAAAIMEQERSEPSGG